MWEMSAARFICAMRKSGFAPLQLPHATKAPEMLNLHTQWSNCSVLVMRLPKAAALLSGIIVARDLHIASAGASGGSVRNTYCARKAI
jgi:hypothetical protein